ncbi:hypothetical protein F5Y17DRAFT_457682 [Xylariaceae sp. FL0594]|nr:hypothetical protein F5Y17DRAFT_457682 [Xylariaceae sp. FL0594]
MATTSPHTESDGDIIDQTADPTATNGQTLTSGKWTQAHLQALCVHFREDVSAEDTYQDGSQPLLRALIPIKEKDILERKILALTNAYTVYAQVKALDAILFFRNWYQVPVHEDSLVVDGARVAVDAVSFSYLDECIMRLAVGQRQYRLPLLYRSRLGPLSIYFLPAGIIRHPPYEPCIAAALIAISQSCSPSTAKSPVRVQLLFTRHDDSHYMRVYTAHVSQDILERFRHPNQAPTASLGPDTIPSALVKVAYVRIPYEPQGTFGCRLLAALSIRATTMHPDHYFGQLKRKFGRHHMRNGFGGEVIFTLDPAKGRELETQHLVVCSFATYSTRFPEDDGGLRLREPLQSGEGYTLHPRNCYYTILEAKKLFQQFHEGRPVISDAWLGQMTAEALAGRLTRQELGNRNPNVFVIAASSHYLRFLHFVITDEYLLEVEQDRPELTLPVTSTRWLDLQDPRDRVSATANVLALVQWAE